MDVFMNESTQLLCTFVDRHNVQDIIDIIYNTYMLPFNKIYVLENTDNADQLVLTYNVGRVISLTPSVLSTISVHRKKQTNTIYTINAINRLIESKNNGVLDKTYRINWEELQNTILVTAYGKLKIVNTRLLNVINL